MKCTIKKVFSVVTGLLLFASSSAFATTIDWNTWVSGSAGTIATASGPIAVTYTPGGQLMSGYPSYTPASTFADGTIVANAPTSANGIVQITGGNQQQLNTITFSEAVVNPVMAIWSLGRNSWEASFIFRDATPIKVSGGPIAEYGGGSIDVSGNAVVGEEGNGTVEFLGTYTSLSWINPTYEFWYGFNVGAPVSEPVPEPGTALLLGAGVFGLVVWRKRKTAA